MWGVGGLDTIAMAKGKSAVMNNVCKSKEGVKGGREQGERNGRRGGGVVYYVPACSAICQVVGLILIIDSLLFFFFFSF